MHTVVFLFQQITSHDLVYLAAKAVMIIAIFWFGNKIRPRWHHAANCIVAVLIIRLFLFDNIFSWYGYQRYLSADDVGWRQKSVIGYEYQKFVKKSEYTKFLAVGSSQTGAVYGPYASRHGSPKLFSLAGMSPLDLILYRKYIKSFGPDYILLYLSEFDLARNPSLDAAKIAPSQGLYLINLYPLLREVAEHSQSYTALKEMLVGEFLPEYKYAFIFSGIRDKILGKNQALAMPIWTEIPDDLSLQYHLQNMATNTSMEVIDVNNRILTHFLSYCRDESLKVIIVEGQYHPLGYTDKSLALHQVVHQNLLNIDNEFNNVTFIPRTEVMNFTEADYKDGYHVKPLPAYQFVENLMVYIDSME